MAKTFVPLSPEALQLMEKLEAEIESLRGQLAEARRVTLLAQDIERTAKFRMDEVVQQGPLRGTRCIPLESNLNSYFQGRRDAAKDLLRPLPAPPNEEE